MGKGNLRRMLYPTTLFSDMQSPWHIQPVSQQGNSTTDNLALSCRSCNSFKAARVTGVDPKTGETVRLFHPRDDIWQQHFHASEETTEIVGISSIGRATVVGLALNSNQQRAARLLWIRLGIFP